MCVLEVIVTRAIIPGVVFQGVVFPGVCPDDWRVGRILKNEGRGRGGGTE